MWNKIYSADLFYGRSFPDGKQLEDYKLITELYYLVGEVYFISDPMYHWCMRDNSQSKKGFSREKLSIIDTAEEIKDYFIQNCNDKEIIVATYYFLFRQYADVMWGSINKTKRLDKHLMKKYKKKGSRILQDYLKAAEIKKDYKRIIKCLISMTV